MLNTENNSKIETKDDKVDVKDNLDKLTAELLISNKSTDTLGKFGKVLNAKMYSIGLDKTAAYLNPIEARNDMRDFMLSKGAWKYLLGLVVFLVTFYYFMAWLVGTGMSSNV